MYVWFAGTDTTFLMQDALQVKIESYRPYLFSVAYNILGEVQEAEDIVQDSFEFMLTLPSGYVQNEKAYLTRVVANKSIDRLKDLKKARKLYPGIWLPEPYVQPEETVFASEKPLDLLSYGLMYVIEQLNPIERAVFILREAFNFSYSELSQICGISEVNCRQTLSRARKKITQSGARSQADQKVYQQLLEAFLKARQEGNLEALTTLLQKDVVLYSDGGGKKPAAMLSLNGIETVIKFLQGIARRPDTRHLTVRKVQINQKPGLLFLMENTPDTLFYVDTDGSLISKMYVIRNPDKFYFAKTVTKQA